MTAGKLNVTGASTMTGCRYGYSSAPTPAGSEARSDRNGRGDTAHHALRAGAFQQAKARDA